MTGDRHQQLRAMIIGALLALVEPPSTIAAGTDEQAAGLVKDLAPGYQPWVSSPLSAPSADSETLLFALQALLGLGILVCCLAALRKRVRSGKREGLHAD